MTMLQPNREQIEKVIAKFIAEDKLIDETEELLHKMSPESQKPVITAFNPLYAIEVLLPELYKDIAFWWFDVWAKKDQRFVYENGQGKQYEVIARDIANLHGWLLFNGHIDE